MDQCEDRGTTLSGEQDRGTTLSGEQDRGTTLSGEQDLQTKAQRIHQRPDSPEPEPSCVSFKSDRSKEKPLWFENQVSPTAEVEPAGVRWLTPGLRKYSCKLTIDTNTVNRNLKLSDNNRKVTHVKEFQPYPDHPERFHSSPQLLCRDGLTGRCYWEVERRGDVDILVSYRGSRRRGLMADCEFGGNDQSWSLECSGGSYFVWDNNRQTYTSSSTSVYDRVAVYVDCPAGSLSFYSVSSDSLIHLYTFNTTFTQPLYPGFLLWSAGSSVSLCPLQD